MNDTDFQKLLVADRIFRREFVVWVDEFQKRNTNEIPNIHRIHFSSTRVRVIFPQTGMVWMAFVLETCEKFSLNMKQVCIYNENEELWLSFRRPKQ